MNQPSCSGINNSNTASMDIDTSQNLTSNSNVTTNQLESSTSSVSEQVSDINDYEVQEENNPNINCNNMRNASAMTDRTPMEDTNILNPFHRELQEYFQ